MASGSLQDSIDYRICPHWVSIDLLLLPTPHPLGFCFFETKSHYIALAVLEFTEGED